MTKDEIREKITGILTNDFDVAPDKITPEATFRGDMGMDSLDIVDFIMLMQKDFGYKSPVESYRELHTLDSVVAFVEKTLADG